MNLHRGDDTGKGTVIYFLLASLILLIFSSLRPLNADEGYYVLSASKILNGKIPYVDFRFHHMPLMIYVYSFVSGLGFWALVLGRLLSILFIVVTAICIYRFILIETKDSSLAGLFLLFYFLNAFFLDWAVTIKIYAISSLLLTLAVLTFKKVIDSDNYLQNLFLASLLFGFLLMSRIVFAAIVLVFLIFTVHSIVKRPPSGRIKAVLAVMSGLGVVLVLFMLFFGSHPSDVYSNVVEEPAMITNLVQHSYLKSFFKLSLFFIVPQNLLLLAVILFSGFKYSLFEKFLVANIGAYFLVHLPTQMLPEYLSNVSPIFILLSVLRYRKFEHNLPKIRYKTVIAVYLIFIPFGIAHLKHIIEQRPLMPSPWQMYAICRKIDSLGGSTILSSWEGFPVFCGKTSVYRERYLPVFEQIRNDSSVIRKFRLTSPDDSRPLILNKVPDIIIYDSEEPRSLEGLLDLIKANYNLAFSFNYLTIYKK